ncbi:hypothetical protein C0991_005471, partial [Blastosporella zonata]
MEEEASARVSSDCLNDLIESIALIIIERQHALCCYLNLLLQIKIVLCCNERIPNNETPVLFKVWHVWPIPERFICKRQEFVNEIEAIVKGIISGGIRAIVAMLESILKIITDVDF